MLLFYSYGGPFLQVGGFFVLMGGGRFLGLPPLRKFLRKPKICTIFKFTHFWGLPSSRAYLALMGRLLALFRPVGRLLGACLAFVSVLVHQINTWYVQ